MSFPLWTLPHVPRALVIRQVEPINVIQLSMKSKRLKSFLMIFKLFAYKLSLSFGADQGCSYDYKPPDCIHLSILFNEDDDWNYFERKSEWHFEFFAQNDAEKQLQRLQTQNLCILYDLGSQVLRIQRIQALTNHILDIVYFKKYELGHFIIPGYNSWNNFFLKDQINNFEKVDIDTRRFETWSAVALQDLFDNLRTEELWLKIRVDTPGARFKFNKMTHFHLHECDWLSVEDLIEVDSEWYYLSLIEPMDLMKIVNAWKSGKKLENLFEMTMDFQGKVSADDVLQQIDQFEGVRKDEEYGDDARFFKRDTDGQIAFICVAEQYFEFSLNKIGCTP
ncbi:hypothetical protein CAEBREN_26099 [Caenorhabditis brenneri]|uniref:F-box associated domain-containing protein n=1 Tax=Caenorhabditis brenneri TaxID=135651 RepID=G0N2M7_CAEBE|nr:hypothetical protein CAEBREN_26099 [Caenorhabditis brenneri]